jgi:pyridoxal phosphate enzyme (YggS family)
MSIKNNIAIFQQELIVKNCKLIAVSKTHPAQSIQEAYDAGQRIFGENKVQELVPKYEVLPKDIQWHLIGHLQSNKVRYVAPFVSLIHSVDSIKLLEEIDKQGRKINRVIHCLLQIHIAQEETKFGLDENELLQLMNSSTLSGYTHIHIEGLMGMATLTENKELIRKEFRSLKKIFDRISLLNKPANVEMKELSMGMSSDYRIAVEEGSTMVRIGTAIFGQRESMN